MDRILKDFTYRHGIAELLWAIVRECEVRHQHYAPSESVFSIWIEILTKYIPIMIQEAKERYS